MKPVMYRSVLSTGETIRVFPLLLQGRSLLSAVWVDTFTVNMWDEWDSLINEGRVVASKVNRRP